MSVTPSVAGHQQAPYQTSGPEQVPDLLGRACMSALAIASPGMCEVSEVFGLAAVRLALGAWRDAWERGG